MWFVQRVAYMLYKKYTECIHDYDILYRMKTKITLLDREHTEYIIYSSLRRRKYALSAVCAADVCCFFVVVFCEDVVFLCWVHLSADDFTLWWFILFYSYTKSATRIILSPLRVVWAGDSPPCILIILCIMLVCSAVCIIYNIRFWYMVVLVAHDSCGVRPAAAALTPRTAADSRDHI